MDPRLWIICGLLALWGVVFTVIGIVKKVTHQVLSGVAVILLAGSMPLLNAPSFAGWLLVGVAIPLAVISVVLRVMLLFRER